MTLPAIQTPHWRLALLSLDLAPVLAARLGLDLTAEGNEPALEHLLQLLARHLAPAASGVILDPVYSYDLAVKELDQAGLLFRLEKLAAEVAPEFTPTLIANWGVDHIRQHYAWAKLELPYHPSEENALTKKQLVAELNDFCHHEGIGFLLKLMLYNPTPEALNPAQFQMDQLTAVQDLAKFCQVMALQYPQDALACATLTAELDIPWIILGEQTQYDTFKDQLRTALDNGAAGFLVEETLWQEAYQLRQSDEHSLDWEAIEAFVATTARDRLIELTRITDESGVSEGEN